MIACVSINSFIYPKQTCSGRGLLVSSILCLFILLLSLKKKNKDNLLELCRHLVAGEKKVIVKNEFCKN